MMIALGQPEIIPGDWDGNVRNALDMIEKAADRNARWILLPEMWACGFPVEEPDRAAGRTGSLLAELSNLADKHDIVIVGSLPEKTDREFFNTVYVIEPDGRILNAYKKSLPRTETSKDIASDEDAVPALIDSSQGPIGFLLGPDLLLPELSRYLVLRGARYLFSLSYRPDFQRDLWKCVIRSRAAENRVHVIAVNAAGRPSQPSNGGLSGCSMAAAPDGSILAEGGEGPELITVDVDTETVSNVTEDRRQSNRCKAYIDWPSETEAAAGIDSQEAVRIVRRVQDGGGRVVFTNGCFDLLHAGHVSYLRQARSLGDMLVVGINSDRSVREIKGPTRPVHSEEDRKQVLLGLSCVDLVVPFDEPDPYRLIGELRPDVLVKGEDWAEDEIIGSDLVLSWGGSVVRLPLKEGLSTTGIIEKILQPPSPAEKS